MILKDYSYTVFLLRHNNSRQYFSKIEGVEPPTPPTPHPPKKGHLMAAASPRNHLNIYNLETTSAQML